jgi:hypothetical protein
MRWSVDKALLHKCAFLEDGLQKDIHIEREGRESERKRKIVLQETRNPKLPTHTE